MSTQKIILIVGSVYAVIFGLCYSFAIKDSRGSSITENISKVRTIQYGLLTYYASHGVYPDNLQSLVKENILEKEALLLYKLELYYVNDRDIDEDKIVLYTTAEEHGKAIAGYVDGSVMTIEPEELKKLLTEQGITPPDTL